MNCVSHQSNLLYDEPLVSRVTDRGIASSQTETGEGSDIRPLLPPDDTYRHTCTRPPGTRPRVDLFHVVRYLTCPVLVREFLVDLGVNGQTGSKIGLLGSPRLP